MPNLNEIAPQGSLTPAQPWHRTVTVEDLMPVLDLATAVRRRNIMVEVTKTLLKEGIDYGAIPGTDQKPTLLKPGAERLCSMYGLSAESCELAAIEDWDGGGQGHGEPLFYYKLLVRLTKNGILLGEGIGACSSRESKYRYRSAERRCPKCAKSAIIKGKEEYGGGWLCYVRKGGCGAKFKDGDRAIEDQAVGRVLNPDIADVVNTILKMAHKRALVAAVLTVTNASEFFTQDEEDMQIIDLTSPPPSAPTPPPTAPPPPGKPPGATPPKPEQPAAMEPVPEAVLLMWSSFINIAKVCEGFAKLKAWLIQYLGPEEGARTYYWILKQHGGVDHANQLKRNAAKRASYKMWQVIQQAEMLHAPDAQPVRETAEEPKP